MSSSSSSDITMMSMGRCGATFSPESDSRHRTTGRVQRSFFDTLLVAAFWIFLARLFPPVDILAVNLIRVVERAVFILVDLTVMVMVMGLNKSGCQAALCIVRLVVPMWSCRDLWLARECKGAVSNQWCVAPWLMSRVASPSFAAGDWDFEFRPNWGHLLSNLKYSAPGGSLAFYSDVMLNRNT